MGVWGGGGDLRLAAKCETLCRQRGRLLGYGMTGAAPQLPNYHQRQGYAPLVHEFTFYLPRPGSSARSFFCRGNLFRQGLPNVSVHLGGLVGSRGFPHPKHSLSKRGAARAGFKNFIPPPPAFSRSSRLQGDSSSSWFPGTKVQGSLRRIGVPFGK